MSTDKFKKADFRALQQVSVLSGGFMMGWGCLMMLFMEIVTERLVSSIKNANSDVKPNLNPILHSTNVHTHWTLKWT